MINIFIELQYINREYGVLEGIITHTIMICTYLFTVVQHLFRLFDQIRVPLLSCIKCNRLDL